MNLIQRLLLAKKIRMEVDPSCIFSPEGSSTLNVYTVVLRHGNRKLKLPQADRKRKKPSAFVILEALIEDAAMLERTSTFTAWCQEFGCDPKEDLARREYQQVQWYTNALRHFLGETYFREAIKDWEEKNASILYQPVEV